MAHDYLEEDYEKYYKEGWRPHPLGTHELIPVGQLRDMCSPGERQERETHQRLSKYEVLQTDPLLSCRKLTIKEFKRSCGQEFSHPMDLRPWSILQKTMKHLLLDICFQNDDWMVISDFVFDRMKAVRQDLIIQRIEGQRYIEILEGSIRFLVYSMYKLTCTLKDYTKLELPKKIISNDGPVRGLDNYELNVLREMKLTMQCLRDCLNSLLIQYQNSPTSPNRSLFESINLIVNLPFLHGHTIINYKSQFIADSENRINDPMFSLVYRMYIYHLVKCHRSALELLPKLYEYPLLVLAYAPAISQLQVLSMRTLKEACSSSGSHTLSLRHLSDQICPEILEEDIQDRVNFVVMMAKQFDIFDEARGLCDFKKKRNTRDIRLPRDFEEKAIWESEKVRKFEEAEGDNETRIYALQMIAGRNWFFYRDVINFHGVEAILTP